eukprot:365776-Chlamydomonas_euryale.AAC.7
MQRRDTGWRHRVVGASHCRSLALKRRLAVPRRGTLRIVSDDASREAGLQGLHPTRPSLCSAYHVGACHPLPPGQVGSSPPAGKPGLQTV